MQPSVQNFDMKCEFSFCASLVILDIHFAVQLQPSLWQFDVKLDGIGLRILVINSFDFHGAVKLQLIVWSFAVKFEVYRFVRPLHSLNAVQFLEVWSVSISITVV